MITTERVVAVRRAASKATNATKDDVRAIGVVVERIESKLAALTVAPRETVLDKLLEK